MDQAAEPVPGQDPDVVAQRAWMRLPGGRILSRRPVRPVAVAVAGVLARGQPQVPFAGDQHPARALAPGAADPAFRVPFARSGS
jgi:hypothetical protein